MKCLVVGGTGFLGGAIVDALVRGGHAVTILSRGKTARPTQHAVETIRADRFGDLRAIAGQAFDWVFDTCAFDPEAVDRLLRVIGATCQRYLLISSISVYGRFLRPGLDETEPVPNATAADLSVAARLTGDARGSAMSYGASYGPLKRACEIKAAEQLGDRATILRVGLLVGAGDYTDRLTWWVRRIDEARGGRRRIPAPGPRNRRVQLIDVRDVADFAVHCADARLAGIWNVTGEARPLSDILEPIIGASNSDAELAWVSEASILEAGVEAWTDIPLMAPTGSDFRYFLEVSAAKAMRHGLDFRPYEETLRDLLEWDRLRRDERLKGGMTAQQEAELLAADDRRGAL